METTELTPILKPVRRFDPNELGMHLKAHHPGCPKRVRKKLISNIIERPWVGISLGGAVGITIENYLRHNISGYDNLLRLGIDRKYARKLIRPQIDAILALWRNPPTPNLP